MKTEDKREELDDSVVKDFAASFWVISVGFSIICNIILLNIIINNKWKEIFSNESIIGIVILILFYLMVHFVLIFGWKIGYNRMFK